MQMIDTNIFWYGKTFRAILMELRNFSVDDLKLGTDDDSSMLATQETLAKNLVYIMNIPEGKLGTT